MEQILQASKKQFAAITPLLPSNINYCNYSIYIPFKRLGTPQLPVEVTLPMCYFGLGRFIDALS